MYEPGTLEVVAYKDGRKWATDRVRTAQPAARLEALPDRAEIRADGRDLSFVTVRLVDQDGVLAPRASHRIRFEVEGPGEIVATNNGDPTSFEPFPSARTQRLWRPVPRDRSGQGGTAGPHQADGVQRGPRRGHRGDHLRSWAAVNCVKRAPSAADPRSRFAGRARPGDDSGVHRRPVSTPIGAGLALLLGATAARPAVHALRVSPDRRHLADAR